MQTFPGPFNSFILPCHDGFLRFLSASLSFIRWSNLTSLSTKAWMHWQLESAEQCSPWSLLSARPWSRLNRNLLGFIHCWNSFWVRWCDSIFLMFLSCSSQIPAPFVFSIVPLWAFLCHMLGVLWNHWIHIHCNNILWIFAVLLFCIVVHWDSVLDVTEEYFAPLFRW